MDIIEMIDREISDLQKAKAILSGSTKGDVVRHRISKAAKPHRNMTPEGRARIAAAQKARWAKIRRKAA